MENTFQYHFADIIVGESENIETPDDGEDDSVEYAEPEVIAGELENEDDESPPPCVLVEECERL